MTDPMTPAQRAAAVEKALIRVRELSGAASWNDPRIEEIWTVSNAALAPLPSPGEPEGSKRFNDTTGAFTWNRRPATEHPDRCVCQNETTPHKHYADPPYSCARCSQCKGYTPASPWEPSRGGEGARGDERENIQDNPQSWVAWRDKAADLTIDLAEARAALREAAKLMERPEAHRHWDHTIQDWLASPAVSQALRKEGE